MKQVTSYVGIDAHRKDLFIAMPGPCGYATTDADCAGGLCGGGAGADSAEAG